MVNTYREALKCEVVREAVFAGKTTPMLFGQPQTWVASLVEALQADARGDVDLAREAAQRRPRRRAGHGRHARRARRSNGSPTPTRASARCSRRWSTAATTGCRSPPWPRSSIEAPADLRDLVWAPAHLTLANGGETVALVPTRYPGSGGEGDGALQLSRKTEWLEIGPEQYRGLGQRILTTSDAELGLLEVREIVLHAAPAAA